MPTTNVNTLSKVLVYSLLFCLAFTSCHKGIKVSGNTQIPGIPSDFFREELYLKFLNNKKPISQKAVRLPETDFYLIYTSCEREEPDPDSYIPADKQKAKIFVYDLSRKKILPELTQTLHEKLLADGYFDLNACGGLASMDTARFVSTGKEVLIDQFYAPGAEHANCISKISWNAEKKNLKISRSQGPSGTGTEQSDPFILLEEGNKRWAENKKMEAVEIWYPAYRIWEKSEDPNEDPFPELLEKLGNGLKETKNFGQAEKVLMDAISISPGNMKLYVLMGELYEGMNEKENAIRYYEQALTQQNGTYSEEEILTRISKLKKD